MTLILNLHVLPVWFASAFLDSLPACHVHVNVIYVYMYMHGPQQQLSSTPEALYRAIEMAEDQELLIEGEDGDGDGGGVDEGLIVQLSKRDSRSISQRSRQTRRGRSTTVSCSRCSFNSTQFVHVHVCMYMYILSAYCMSA